MKVAREAAAALVLYMLPVAVLAAGPSGSDQEDPLAGFQQARNYFSRGMEHFSNGDYDWAEEFFDKTLACCPFYSEAYLYRGLCQYNSGDYRGALADIQAGMESYERWEGMKFDFESARYQSAQLRLQELRQGLAGVPPPEAENCGAARKMYERLIEETEDEVKNPPRLAEAVVPAEYYYQAGNCHMQLGNYNDAYSSFMTALETDSGHAQAHNNLAILLYMARRYQDAWLHLQAAKQHGAAVNPQFEAALNQALMGGG